VARVTTAVMRREARAALDSRFVALREARLGMLTARPREGWVKAIREALGMSAADLAIRMGVVESTVQRLEAGEKAETTQLDTLRKAAAALDCDLVYVLVPRKALTDQVDEQARHKARAFVSRVTHTMALEDQKAPDHVTVALLEQQAATWRDRPGLWHAD